MKHVHNLEVIAIKELQSSSSTNSNVIGKRQNCTMLLYFESFGCHCELLVVFGSLYFVCQILCACTPLRNGISTEEESTSIVVCSYMVCRATLHSALSATRFTGFGEEVKVLLCLIKRLACSNCLHLLRCDQRPVEVFVISRLHV